MAACGHLQFAVLAIDTTRAPATVRLTLQRLGHFAGVDMPTGRPADTASSSLPRTGSDDEQNHHDDDGNDESEDGDRAGAHGVSEPVGINRGTLLQFADRFARGLIAPERPPRMLSGHDFGGRILSVSAAAGPFARASERAVVKAETLAADDKQ